MLNIVEQRKCETNIVEYTRTLGLPIHRILYNIYIYKCYVLLIYTIHIYLQYNTVYTTCLYNPSTLAVCTTHTQTHSLNKSQTQNRSTQLELDDSIDKAICKSFGNHLQHTQTQM